MKTETKPSVAPDAGQLFIDRLTAWLSGYVAFANPGYAFVVALWIVHTWFCEKFEATPYLAVSGPAGTGKSRLGKLVQHTCRNGKMFADIEAAQFYRLADSYGPGKMTLIADEAEKFSGNRANVLRAVMNAGYLQGETIPRTLPGGQVAEFCCYGPKMFLLIGDVMHTLRTRSILLWTERAKPTRDYDTLTARAEGREFVSLIERGMVLHSTPEPRYPEFLDGREREIWGAIFGIAHALKLDDAHMTLLRRTCADMVALKSAPKTRYDRMEDDNDADRAHRDNAMRDMQTVVKGWPRKNISSEELIERMKGIDVAGWRNFKGVGLDAMALSNLVDVFGVKPAPRKVGNGETKRGYIVSQIEGVKL